MTRVFLHMRFNINRIFWNGSAVPCSQTSLSLSVSEARTPSEPPLRSPTNPRDSFCPKKHLLGACSSSLFLGEQHPRKHSPEGRRELPLRQTFPLKNRRSSARVVCKAAVGSLWTCMASDGNVLSWAALAACAMLMTWKFLPSLRKRKASTGST